MKSGGDTLVHCQSVTRTYRRGSRSWWHSWRGNGEPLPTVTALDEVDVEIGRGERVGLAGPSGSGKTTLLHLLAGVDTPTEGSVIIDGTDLSTLSSGQRTCFRLETIGVVYQHFHLLGSLSARANVALPLVERGVPKSRRRRRAKSLLESVGLEDRAGHRPTELSGGEQQRVAIARALATDPALVVADEPTGELDSSTADRVLDALTAVSGDRTVVLASHDEQALEYTDRVVRLADGTRVQETPAATVQHD
jgi:putative ABC transport system ATP-binding protein